MVKRFFTLFFIFSVLFLTACKGGNTSQEVGNTSLEGQRLIFGVIQKGPVIEGGSVLVYELDSKAERTGKLLQASVYGKQGSFAFKPPIVWKNAVEVVFSGRYFNEATDSISIDVVNLSTIVLLQDNIQVSANINILSTMVAARIRSLLRQNKLSFSEAIISASMSIKNITGVSGKRANTVDITRGGVSQDSAVILFVSGVIADLANKYQKPTQQLINQLASNFAIDGQLSGTSEKWETRLKGLALNREKIHTDKYASRLSRYMGSAGEVPTSASLPNTITFTARPTVKVETDLLVKPSTMVILDGSKSEGENGKSIKYTWFQTDHNNERIELKNRFESKLSFISPDSENVTMQFTLLVTDSDGMTDHKVVRVVTAKSRPSISEFIATDSDGDIVTNTIFVNEGGAFSFKLKINNPVGREVRYRLLAAPSYGEVSFRPTGEGEFSQVDVRYTHKGLEERTDAFVFEVVDDLGNTGSLRIDVIIVPVNDPPNANNDLFQVTAGEILEGNVVLNDSDSEGDMLTVRLIGEGLDLSEDGSFSYQFYGSISENVEKIFQYELSDGHGGVSVATITIIVIPNSNTNNVPIAENDSFTISKNKPVILDVLANDTDLDEDPLSIEAVSQPAHGHVVINGSLLRYTPDIGFSGSDSFTYAINDGRLGQDSASVQVTVVNNRPVAHSQNLVTNQNTPLNFDLTGEDVDEDVFIFEVPANTVSGGVLTNSSGSVLYTPPNNFAGEDSFRFSVHDGEVSSLEVTVNIIVEELNQQPVAVITGLQEAIYEGKALTLDASSSSSQNGSVVLYKWTYPDGNTEEVSVNNVLYTIPSITDTEGAQALVFKLQVKNSLGEWSDEVEATVVSYDLPNIAFSPTVYSVTEGTSSIVSLSADSSVGLVSISVSLSGNVIAGSSSVSVGYKTIDSNPDSFEATEGSLNFDNSGDVRTFDVQIVQDENSESSESFRAVLLNSNNAEIVDGVATIYIIDDDSTTQHTLIAINPVFTFVTDDFAESDEVISLSLTGAQLATDSDGHNLSVESCSSLSVEGGGNDSVDLNIVSGVAEFTHSDRICFIQANFTCRVVDNNGLSVDSEIIVKHEDEVGVCG